MAVSAEFIIRPNATFNARTWPWLFGLLSFICLSVAIRFAILGYWVILPFAILDMVAVGLVLYFLMRHHSYVEKVQIKENDLVIRHVQKNNRLSWCFSLHWVSVNLQKSKHRWYPRRLLVGSKGEWVEIGQCLTDSEREALAVALKRAISKHTVPFQRNLSTISGLS